MGSLLTASWLDGLDPITVLDDASVSAARERTRAQSAAAGLTGLQSEAMATTASELARNQLVHAQKGALAVHLVKRDGVQGVEVVAADAGSGIADPARALAGDGPHPEGSLGAGLAAVCRLADEVDFDIRLGEGTCIRARKFLNPLPRREVALIGRPHREERVCGDDAAVAWLNETLLIGVADGLGHGEPAREASEKAIGTFQREFARPPEEILRLCDTALKGTRGAAVSVIRLEPGRLTHAGIGNVEVRVFSQKRMPTVRLSAFPGVIGDTRGSPRIKVETSPVPERYLLVTFTDGLSSRLDVSDDGSDFRDPPVVVAQRFLTQFGKEHDDALVIVAR